jgi:Protein of unknown function (DUF1761)
MEESMTSAQSNVRQNYWAILVAGTACFLFAAGWFTSFMMPWLAGTGRTIEGLKATGISPALQYGTAYLAALVVAAAISRFTQMTGEQTALRGIKVAALLWFGFVLTTWATEYVYEVRPLSLLAINAGFWLPAMVMMGAIVGGWKKKP